MAREWRGAAHDGHYITGIERNKPRTFGGESPTGVGMHAEFIHPSIWRNQIYWDRRDEGRRSNPSWVQPFQAPRQMRQFPPGGLEAGLAPGGTPEQKSPIFEPLVQDPMIRRHLSQVYHPFQPGIDPLPPNPPMYQ